MRVAGCFTLQLNNTLMADIRELTTVEQWSQALPTLLTLRPDITQEALLENRAACLAGGYRLFGLLIGGTIVCIAGINIRPHIQYGRQMEIEDFSTHLHHKRKGYGSLLLQYLFELAKKEGCFRVKLDSGNSRTDAHAFYERAGMKRTGFRFEYRF